MEKDWRRRRIKESLHIMTKDTFNRDSGVYVDRRWRTLLWMTLNNLWMLWLRVIFYLLKMLLLIVKTVVVLCCFSLISELLNYGALWWLLFMLSCSLLNFNLPDVCVCVCVCVSSDIQSHPEEERSCSKARIKAKTREFVLNLFTYCYDSRRRRHLWDNIVIGYKF